MYNIHSRMGSLINNAIIFCIFSGAFFISGYAPLMAQPQFRGYLENRFFATFINNDFAVPHLKNSLRLGDYNRARVILSNSASDNSSFTLAVDYFTYHGYIVQQLRQPGSGADPTTASIDQRVVIDRAYIRLYLSRADVTIGKQRISWGRSLLWSPFDVFNRVNFFEPQEEKFGINALRLSIPLGSTSSIEGVLAPESRVDRSSVGSRLLWNWHGMEFVVTAIHNVNPFFRQNIYGLEWKGDKVVGIWFEGAYFNEKPLAAPAAGVFASKYFRWLAGTDYSFDIGGGLYFMTEYTHDESGEPEKELYNYGFLLSGLRSLLARDYVYSTIRYQFSDITSLSAAILTNVNDRGVLFMPSISRLLFPDTELRLGIYFALAESGTEFKPLPESDPLNYLGNAVMYSWLKIYF